MKPVDLVAIGIGTVSGAASPDDVESILASFVAAVAVYVIRAAWRRFGPAIEPRPGPEKKSDSGEENP
jgi:hypothetical protein